MRIWPVASGVAWRTLKNVFTNPALLFPSIMFPLFFFTAFAGGLSQVSQVPGFDFPPGYTAFQFCFVLVQSAAFGGAVDVVGMYTLALLVNVAGLLWACGVAMRFRTIQAGPIMQMPVFLILFFAPVYVPLGLLSGWIETVATLNPLTYVLEAVRSMLAGDEVHVASAFVIAAGLVVLFSVWSLRGLRKAEAAG